MKTKKPKNTRRYTIADITPIIKKLEKIEDNLIFTNFFSIFALILTVMFAVFALAIATNNYDFDCQ